MTEPYGCAGCRCRPIDPYVSDEYIEWEASPACPHHGDTYIDDDGLPHQPFDHDIEGVPYMHPTCGQDGEWWPCRTVRGRAEGEAAPHTPPTPEQAAAMTEAMNNPKLAARKLPWRERGGHPSGNVTADQLPPPPPMFIADPHTPPTPKEWTAIPKALNSPDAPRRKLPPRRDLSTPPDGPECPPGIHSMFDPCPGGCLNGNDTNGDVTDNDVTDTLEAHRLALSEAIGLGTGGPWDVILHRAAELHAAETAAAKGQAAGLPDRDGLRQRIAGVLHAQLPGCTHDEHGADCGSLANAVLAVLFAPDQEAATDPALIGDTIPALLSNGWMQCPCGWETEGSSNELTKTFTEHYTTEHRDGDRCTSASRRLWQKLRNLLPRR